MISTAHTGAAGELFACQYFLSHGVEVFRNVAPAGPVDLMVYNKINSQSAPVDIKSVRSPYIRADGSYSLGISPKLRDDGVWQLTYVHGEDSLRIPEGFWESLGLNISIENLSQPTGDLHGKEEDKR
tara:strand:+ start:94 stop:474 length:381 start_codon:yes stop_codon:yes gene_type:complete